MLAQPSLSAFLEAPPKLHWAERLRGRLEASQEALLEKTQERQQVYLAEDPQKLRISMKSLGTWSHSRASGLIPECSEADIHDAKLPSSVAAMTSRAQSVRKSKSVHVDAGSRCSKPPSTILNVAKAYMELDWFKVIQRRRRLSYLFFAQNLYYWCYTAYIISIILLGAFLLWTLEPAGGMTLPQCLYTATACVSSGFTLVDWTTRSNATYIVSFCLIILGSEPLLHCVPVVLRESSFRMQAMMTRAMLRREESDMRHNSPRQALRRSISEPFDHPTSLSDAAMACEVKRAGSSMLAGARQPLLAVKDLPSTTTPKKPRKTLPIMQENGAPESPSLLGNAVQAAREPPAAERPPASSSGSHFSYSAALEDVHRLEYKALKMVLKIMLGYWFTMHLAGILFFYSYFQFFTGPVQEKLCTEGLHPLPHAAYLTVSAFQNNGLVLTPASATDFQQSPLLLNAIGLLVMAGNTGLPIVMRCIAACLERQAPRGSDRKRVLDFLLKYPRRCFTHLFPAVHTLWLLLVLTTLTLATTAILLSLEWGSLSMKDLSTSDKVWNAFFQATTTRTAGMNAVDVSRFSEASIFVLMVMMYLSTTPTVVVMRFSAVRSGSKAQAELDITGRVEGMQEEALDGQQTLRSQARRYLTQDMTYLALCLFLILVFEKEHFAESSSGDSGDFDFLKVVFEMASAYGTCGLSLGYRNQSGSFSSVWSTSSQMLLVFVMILGRLRGLPDSIDPSVRVSMRKAQPGSGADGLV